MHATFHHRKLRGAGDIRADGQTKPDNFLCNRVTHDHNLFHQDYSAKTMSFSMIQQELSFLLTFWSLMCRRREFFNSKGAKSPESHKRHFLL